jgi:Predicted 3'-5' exonuclease related to the exonuclease domain of PolB
MIRSPVSGAGWRQGGDEHMKPSAIVWDLETVPDLAGFAAANDLVGKSDVEVREAIGEKFPKYIYHSIVCIGALIAHREADHWAVHAVGAPHVGERTEKKLITAFCDKIAELSPQLVTFNGDRAAKRANTPPKADVNSPPWLPPLYGLKLSPPRRSCLEELEHLIKGVRRNRAVA